MELKKISKWEMLFFFLLSPVFNNLTQRPPIMCSEIAEICSSEKRERNPNWLCQENPISVNEWKKEKHIFLLEVRVLRLYLIFFLHHVVGYVSAHKHPGSPCAFLLSRNLQPPGFPFAKKPERGCSAVWPEVKGISHPRDSPVPACPFSFRISIIGQV